MSIPNNIAWSYPESSSKENVNQQVQMFNGMSSIGFRSQTVYPQMPAPSGVPWTTSEMSWIPVTPHSNVVNFTGEQKTKNLHTKRKSDFESEFPTKKHITEEKMAAQLNSLHISTNYVPTATSFQNYNTTDDRLGSNEEDKNNSEMTIEERLKRAQQIILCEEMKKLENEPLIPKSLIERLGKPCMSLVLWKPPPKPNDENDDDGDLAADNNNNPECSTSDYQPIMDVDM